jgi:hypothetical protein
MLMRRESTNATVGPFLGGLGGLLSQERKLSPSSTNALPTNRKKS